MNYRTLQQQTRDAHVCVVCVQHCARSLRKALACSYCYLLWNGVCDLLYRTAKNLTEVLRSLRWWFCDPCPAQTLFPKLNAMPRPLEIFFIFPYAPVSKKDQKKWASLPAHFPLYRVCPDSLVCSAWRTCSKAMLSKYLCIRISTLLLTVHALSSVLCWIP